ncbi:MAG: isoleucine--tRNA ligase [Bacteriovoracaceae bacterium]
MSDEKTQTEQFSFVDAELKTLQFWKENSIFKKSLEKTKNSEPYIFYDGPPFATGLPHHGHLLASTLKDIIPRYFTMKGRYVERRFGWDCHGLPIEHEIDKKLGMSAQAAVETFGVKGYNDHCRGIVDRYTSEWEQTISRLGRWVDFENDYKTMDPEFMESVWWVLSQLWEKDLIYQGTKVVPFSTALGTALSNFEASSNYQSVQDPAITILFKLKDEDAYLAAWTTTPWTLPSNLGVIVGPEIEYVKVEDKDLGKKIYFAKNRLQAYEKKHNLEVLEECKGSDLLGKQYEPLFPYFESERENGAFQIFNDDYVTTDDGTGIVHAAPAFGEDDNRVMKSGGAKALVCPIDDHGLFTKEVSDFEGDYVKDADKKIIKRLKEEGKIYEQDVLVHNYPFCPRSDTPLIYRTIPSWYVKVESIKEKLLASNKQIYWVPDHIKEGRFGKWLEGSRDWAISRNRVWGTPIPIWINDTTGNKVCVGSIAKLKELTGVEVTDLHREYVDDLTFTVDGEEGTYKRVSDVLDCWFESGSMPYAQIHYPFENQETFDKGFPAEFIAEGLDQTRGWFYTLTVLSTALFEKPAFKNVIVNGMVLAADGKKMSKRLKNYTPPDELMQSFGADALRLYLITSGLVKAEEQRFTDDGVKDMVRRAMLPWFNAYKFFSTYAEVDGWDAKKDFHLGENILDRWILSNLQTLKKNISNEMKEYKLYNVVPALYTFIENLTNWYIRLNRGRFWGDGMNDDKKSAYSTLYTAIKELSTAMAPFAPFLSEHVYQELKKFDSNLTEESVHLLDYPVADDSAIDSVLEDAVSRLQQVILLARQRRNQEQIKVKTPLSNLSVIHKSEDVLKEIQKLESYIQKELNVKSVSYEADEASFINFFAKPNAPILGKKLGKEFGKFRKLIQDLGHQELAKLEEVGSIQIDDKTFSSEEILVFREAKEGTKTLSNRFISIDLDCELNDDLVNEGLARELVNRIQKSRKDSELKVDQRINIKYSCDSKLEGILGTHKEYIMGETLALSIEKNSSDHQFDYDVDGNNFKLSIHKAD